MSSYEVFDDILQEFSELMALRDRKKLAIFIEVQELIDDAASKAITMIGDFQNETYIKMLSDNEEALTTVSEAQGQTLSEIIILHLQQWSKNKLKNMAETIIDDILDDE